MIAATNSVEIVWVVLSIGILVVGLIGMTLATTGREVCLALGVFIVGGLLTVTGGIYYTENEEECQIGTVRVTVETEGDDFEECVPWSLIERVVS